jgi:two-component system OmpR family sensor kinase
MRVSFKTRLTLGTVVISALIFGSGALLFLTEFRASVQATTETLLRNDSQTYSAAIAASTAEENGNSNGNNNTGNALDAPAQGQLIALLNPAHKVMLSTLPRVFVGRLDQFTRSTSPAFTTFSQAGQKYRVMKSIVHAWDGTWYVIAARNDATAELITSKVATSLFFGLILLIVLSGMATWVLASTVLRPIKRMHRRALELIEDPRPAFYPKASRATNYPN